MAHRTDEFQTIRSEGGLLPPDLLRRVIDPTAKLAGTRPEDYGLPQNERLNEVITQSWNRLRKHWAEFRAAAGSVPEGEGGTGLTNDKWSLPLLRELGFGLLPSSAGPELGGRTYAIGRFFGPVAVHLVGFGLSLDRRAAGQRGAAAANPHGLVQDFVNRSPGHLWAIVSNGLRLRVLRDSQALSRQSFLEFDLEAMFQGEVYSDFVLLWLMVHATRFAPRENERPDTCWLEYWTKESAEQGTRALEGLRGGVEKALLILGEGFTSHPKNAALRDAFRSGAIPPADFHGQLLRIVYRLIFLFVAEDRALDGQPLLHPRDASEQARIARERYAAHYSTARLRELAGKIKGSRHTDLWRQFQLSVRALSGSDSSAVVRQQLALPTLGSLLWNPTSTAALNDAELTNYDFLEALRHLAFTRQGKVLRPVDYKNLGAEELGGVYESLLALTPQISADGARFTFAEFAGSERKLSGSYYTSDALVQSLLDSSLDPVVDEAIKGRTSTEAERAILALRICDPAVGSGHFLVGAAHRLARHLARVRALMEGESEPSPLRYHHALRDVIGRCLYGVDVRPMAAELCRVSLWLEALEPGKPLSFLDHHIRVGNSLLGATPELIASGIPEEAFNPIDGDDRKACAVLKKRNKAERKGLGALFAEEEAEVQSQLQHAAAVLEELPDERPEDIQAKELAFRRNEHNAEYVGRKRLADTWCAAFVIRKYFSEPGRESSATGIVQRHLNDLAHGRPLPEELTVEIVRLSEQYQFFHWHLEFPAAFAGDLRGFHCVLGNPPWEHLELKELEWFAERSPTIASASTAAERKRMIKALAEQDPSLHESYLEDLRKTDGERHLARDSGLYPFCGTGRINTYAIFAELNRRLMRADGRAGFIVPSGIATDDTTKLFFQDLVEKGSLVSLYDFENRERLFPAVDSRVKFCLLTLTGKAEPSREARFVFFALAIGDLADENRQFILNAADFALLNPNSRTCPIFRSRRDAELTKSIYRRVPVLWVDDPEHNPWDVELRQGLFNLSSESHLFRTAKQLELEGYRLEGNLFASTHDGYLPLYEAKMLHHFDHRWATYRNEDEAVDVLPTAKAQPDFLAQPRYWVRGEIVESAIPHYPRALQMALAFGEARTVQALLHILFGGDALNRGDTLTAKHLFETAPAFDDESQLSGEGVALETQDAARDLARRFPVGSDDWERFTTHADECLDLARDIVERFSPRWFVAWRDICRSTDERTLISAILPRVAIGNSTQLIFRNGHGSKDLMLLVANLCSFVCDYVARQKIGGTHINHQIMKQFPVLERSVYDRCQPWQSAGDTLAAWIRPRVLELSYTANDLKALAIDCGYNGPPFIWDDRRRALIRAELDAAFLHAYGISREDAAYILSDINFPIAAAKQPERFQGILAIYDQMMAAATKGIPYGTPLSPLPGHSPR